MGDNSIFKQASQSKLEYQIAKAREKLEVTLGQAKIFKHTDKKYNQDDYLDELMKKEIPNIKIADNIVIVDGYAFEIDRNEPKIGEYVGEEKDLVFPEITAVVTLAADSKKATIHITAKESTNGISKIEVIQGGYVLETYECGNTKEEVVKDYIAKQNGTYTIKVYAGLTATEKVKVEGLVASVKYSPDGNEEYQKEHQVKVTVSEEIEKVKSIKYQWLQTTVEPTESSFTTVCANGEIITGKGYTGTYYLWTLLETESGKKNIERSEGFNFDNQGPNITTFTATKYSETGIILSATAQDTGLGTIRFEFYVDNELKNTQICEATTSSVTKSAIITGLTTGNHNCKVIVYDAKENSNERTELGATKLYTWEKWSILETYTWGIEKVGSETSAGSYCYDTKYTFYKSYSINNKSGNVNGTNEETYWGWPTGYQCFSGQTFYCFALNTWNTKNNRYYIGYYKKQKYTSYKIITDRKKGNSQYSDVTSKNKSQYPNNNYSGSYWYVYKGIY